MPIRQLRRDACRALAGSSHADGPGALRQHLVGLFASGSLSAQALTKLAWFITRAGGSGVADLARDPDSIGRNAARHLKERLGMNDIADNFLLYVAVPQHHGRGKLATRRPLPILPTHEIIAKMFHNRKHEFMAHVAAPDLLCDNFYSHDTVLAHGAGKCFPLRLFMDWARLDNRQAVLNISMSSLFLPTRVPFGSYHKRIFCKCGCRGAHTLQPILDAVAWVFRVLATGLWPETDYYGNPWPEHSWRHLMAGAELFAGARGVLCEVGGDLDEWAKSCGLPDYRANFGCVKCFKRKRDLHDHGAHCKRRTHEWLVTTATTALTLQPLTEELMDALRRASVSSKKAGGVVLKRNLGSDLQPGDRLEPACAGTVDFWHGEPFQSAPLSQRHAVMYRRPENSLLFISRLFHIPGIQAGIPGLQYDHFLLDSMHCLEIGVVPYYDGLTLKHLISKGFFGQTEAVEVAVSDSVACYWRRDAVRQEQPPVDLQGILSGKGSPCLKAKAHEAKALLGWIVDLLRWRGAANYLDAANGDIGQALLACGSGLLEFYQVCAREPRNMSSGALEHLGILSTRIVQEWGRAGGRSTMKWHILAHHLVRQMSWAGNCTWSHNYADETENFYTRCRGASVHRLHHAKWFLAKWCLDFLSRGGS